MKTLGERAVHKAEGEIGVKEVPDGSNSGPRVREYQAATWLPGSGWPWCAAFVNWVYREIGQPLPDKSAGAWDLTARLARRGWKIRLEHAEPGDIVSWNIGTGHVSLFEKQVTGMVTTIDGNVGNRVDHRVRPARLVRDVIHIPEAHREKPGRKPLFQATTSENGHTRIVATSRTLDGLIRALRRLKRP